MTESDRDDRDVPPNAPHRAPHTDGDAPLDAPFDAPLDAPLDEPLDALSREQAAPPRQAESVAPASVAPSAGGGATAGRSPLRARLVALLAGVALAASGGAAGGAAAWLLTEMQPPAAAPAPWEGPNVVGVAAAQVAASVYTIVSVTDDEGLAVARSGAAVAWRPDGLLVTNHHVVGTSGTARLLTPYGRFIDAEIVGGDPRADVSVLKIEETLQVPTWTDMVPPVGSLAVAIGAPFGLGGSVSAGIVSATHRSVGVVAGASLRDVIQFDAAVNPGNSGGALVNSVGEVFGLVTAIYSTSGVNDGVAFALPAALVRTVADSIVEGKWEPGWLGVLVADVAERGGALVHDVLEGGAADIGGLRGGDVIVQVGESRVTGVADLVSAISRAGRGATVTLEVLREGQPTRLDVTLDSEPERTAR